MAKKKISITVPAEAYLKLKIEFQRRAYQEEPTDKIILEYIDTRKFTAAEIAWQLQHKHGKKRDPQRITRMAKRLGIELSK